MARTRAPCGCGRFVGSRDIWNRSACRWRSRRAICCPIGGVVRCPTSTPRRRSLRCSTRPGRCARRIGRRRSARWLSPARHLKDLQRLELPLPVAVIEVWNDLLWMEAYFAISSRVHDGSFGADDHASGAVDMDSRGPLDPLELPAEIGTRIQVHPATVCCFGRLFFLIAYRALHGDVKSNVRFQVKRLTNVPLVTISQSLGDRL